MTPKLLNIGSSTSGTCVAHRRDKDMIVSLTHRVYTILNFLVLNYFCKKCLYTESVSATFSVIFLICILRKINSCLQRPLNSTHFTHVTTTQSIFFRSKLILCNHSNPVLSSGCCHNTGDLYAAYTPLCSNGLRLLLVL